MTTGYDATNRATGVSGSYNGFTTRYVSGAWYWPHGAENNYTFGNSIWRVFTYNSRLQPSGLWDAINNDSRYFLFLENPIAYGANNNGNVQSLILYASAPGQPGVLTSYTENFTYDNLNRLTSATDTGGWSRSFAYDQYGNGWVTAAPGMGYSLSTPNGNIFNGKNQIGSSPYDAAGNMLALPPGMTFAYDAENRQTSETNSSGLSATYAYDGEGKRVEKILSNGQKVLYVYDALGRLAAEYDLQNPGTPPCATCYLTYDHLGSLRMVTDANANVVARHDYIPFGEEIPSGTAGRGSQFDGYDNVNQKFTGKERDAETSLDFFQARYYGAGMGRFTSADPGNTGSDPRNPQSWNGYAYTGNNPLTRTDPDGLDYSICTNDGDGGQQCSYLASDQAAEEALRNPGPGLSASNGNIYSTDENGNQVQIGTYQHFLGPGDIASEGLQQDYGAELAALGLIRGAGSLLAGASATTSSGVWALGWAARGSVIEEMLGANLPKTFPVIDAFENGIATSIKSVDLTAASYQASDALASKLTGYVDRLASFSGGALGGSEVDGAQITGRVLKLAIPEGGVSAAQQSAISRVTAAAAQKGVQVIVVTVR